MQEGPRHLLMKVVHNCTKMEIIIMATFVLMIFHVHKVMAAFANIVWPLFLNYFLFEFSVDLFIIFILAG